MDGRLGAQEGLHAGEAHDDGLDERDVAEGLERLDQDAQQLLHVVVRDRLGDAAEHDEAARLQCRVVPGNGVRCVSLSSTLHTLNWFIGQIILFKMPIQCVKPKVFFLGFG